MDIYTGKPERAKLFSKAVGADVFKAYSMVGPVSIKLEINHSAHQNRSDDWRLGQFRSNMSSTEVENLFCWNHSKGKRFF